MTGMTALLQNISIISWDVMAWHLTRIKIVSRIAVTTVITVILSSRSFLNEKPDGFRDVFVPLNCCDFFNKWCIVILYSDYSARRVRILMNKRFQIFVSSTYGDLREERKAIIEVLLNANFIPSGMEQFSASTEKQFKYIKRVIDTCDYYLLVMCNNDS